MLYRSLKLPSALSHCSTKARGKTGKGESEASRTRDLSVYSRDYLITRRTRASTETPARLSTSTTTNQPHDDYEIVLIYMHERASNKQ